MRFRTQLTLGVALLIAITSLSGVLAIVTLHMTNGRSVEVTRHVVDDLTAVQQIRVRAEKVVSAARGFLLTGDPEHRTALLAHQADLDRAIDLLRQRQDDPLVAVHLAILEARFYDYSHATAIAALARWQEDDLRRLVHTFESELEPRRRALESSLDALTARERLRVEAEARRAAEAMRTFSLMLLGAFAVCIAISITLASIVIRRLSDQYRRVKAAEAAAERAARARKEIVDIVSHDLLSPLNAIALGLEVIQLQHAEVPHLDTIKDAADRMQRLIKDLHDVSRAEQMKLVLEFRDVRVAELLGATVAQFQERAKRLDVSVRADAPDDLVTRLDRDRIQQVLANLIGNAMRVSRPAGEVVVSAVRQPDSGVSGVSGVSGDSDDSAASVRFAVTDQGPGIPHEELAHLFDAYQQGARSDTEPARSGSLGLGLYICKTLVTAHGGRIGATSELGQGTTLWFEIPQNPQNPQKPQKPADRGP